MIAKGTARCEFCGANAQVWYQPECSSVLCPNCGMEIESHSIVAELRAQKPIHRAKKTNLFRIALQFVQKRAACI